MSLPRFGVTKSVPMNLLAIATIITGIIVAMTMTREFFPRIEPDAARVVLVYPGATPEEVEDGLAIKIEDKLAELEEVDRLTTTLAENGGGIIVRFRSDVDINRGLDKVKQVVDSLQDLPEEAERTIVAEFEPRFPAIMLSLYGSMDELTRKRAIQGIRDDLQSLPGMGEILISGVRAYEITVEVDTARLIEHNLSLPQVSDRIRAWMANLPGGAVRTGEINFSARTLGVEERAEAVRDIVIAAGPEGESLRLSDIATVSDGFADQQFRQRFNGEPSASITVSKVGDQDAVKIAEMVRAYAAGRNGEPLTQTVTQQIFAPHRKVAWELGARNANTLPGKTGTHSDLARFIEGRLSLLTDNAIQGALLILAALFLFLSWRTAYWVVLGLITAIAGTLVLMHAMGITLNLLTMFGVIITLGMLEDDAVVISENIISRHERGEPAITAAIRGAEEVFWPVIATVLTTVVAFLPLTLVKGQMGDLLGALPWVVVCSLLISVFETMLILPGHLAHSLAGMDRRTPSRLDRALQRYEKWRDRRIVATTINGYGRLITLALRHRYVATSLAIGALIVSFGMIAGGRVEFVFLDSTDAETLIVELRMPLGTPIEKTDEVVRRIENAARAQPELKSISAIVGSRNDVESGTSDGEASHVAQVFIELKPVEERDRESTEVTAAIRAAVGNVDGVDQLRFAEISGGPDGPDITVEVSGRGGAAGFEAAMVVAERIKSELANFAGVIDISDDNYLGQRELQIQLRPGAAGLGFSTADVARQVRGALFGLEAHVFSANREDIKVRVRADQAARRSLDAVENMWVLSPLNQRVQLGEIAEIREAEGYATIRRVDRERTITVTADTLPNVNTESIAREFDDHLTQLRTEFPNVNIRYGGRQEELADAFASLPLAFLTAIVLIYVILAWLFSSYVQPLAVMIAIPFGVIGMVWGHLFLGYKLTFLSLIGFVALTGVVVNNSLIFVDFFNTGREHGLKLQEALIQAGKLRLRPIVITTLTTVLGLSPLVLEQSFQAKFLIPMAITICAGLISATVLTLVVLPSILVIIDDITGVFHYLWHGRSRSAEPDPPSHVLITEEG